LDKNTKEGLSSCFKRQTAHVAIYKNVSRETFLSLITPSLGLLLRITALAKQSSGDGEKDNKIVSRETIY